jgi:hypothetical protein
VVVVLTIPHTKTTEADAVVVVVELLPTLTTLDLTLLTQLREVASRVSMLK